MFGEDGSAISTGGQDCCDVCLRQTIEPVQNYDHKKEIKILMYALHRIGCKGEVKVAEWIRGTKMSWTDNFNKKCLSYGNHMGKDMLFWREFIKKCHACSFFS